MSEPGGGSEDVVAPKGSRDETELEETYDRLISEGHERLDRPLLPLISTGFLGGIDVGVGVLAYLVVDAETGNHLLASLAFTIGFVALLLANSELFTENFLVPVISVVAKVGTLSQLLRLWIVTLVANLVGGFVMAAMIVIALPSVHEVAVRSGSHFAHLGVSWRSFFLAVLAGAVITLMTRMQNANENVGVKLVSGCCGSRIASPRVATRVRPADTRIRGCEAPRSRTPGSSSARTPGPWRSAVESSR